jgi:hypothetical protein
MVLEFHLIKWMKILLSFERLSITDSLQVELSLFQKNDFVHWKQSCSETFQRRTFRQWKVFIFSLVKHSLTRVFSSFASYFREKLLKTNELCLLHSIFLRQLEVTTADRWNCLLFFSSKCFVLFGHKKTPQHVTTVLKLTKRSFLHLLHPHLPAALMKFGLALTQKQHASNHGGVELLHAPGGKNHFQSSMLTALKHSILRCWCKSGFKRATSGGVCVQFCKATPIEYPIVKTA